MTPSLIFVAVVVLLWAAVVIFGISCEKRQKKEDERVRQQTGEALRAMTPAERAAFFRGSAARFDEFVEEATARLRADPPEPPGSGFC